MHLTKLWMTMHMSGLLHSEQSQHRRASHHYFTNWLICKIQVVSHKSALSKLHAVCFNGKSQHLRQNGLVSCCKPWASRISCSAASGNEVIFKD